MRVAGWVLLLGCALGGVGAAQAEVAASPDEGGLRAVSALSAQIYLTTREFERGHAAGAATMPDIDHRIAELRLAVDLLRRQAGGSEGTAGSPFARKALQLSLLVSNLERAAKSPAASALPALIPARLPPNRRIQFATIAPGAGGTCSAALGFGPGAELDGVMRARAEIWLRIDSIPGDALVVDTKASPLDTEIAVFTSCPTLATAAPENSSDDAFGLAAAVLVKAPATKGPRWLRVRNLGHSGDVSIIAGTTGTIRGRVTDSVSGLPLSAQLYAFDTDGYNVGQGYGNGDGTYEFLMPAGDYYVTATTFDHLGEAWPNAECVRAYDFASCAPGQAQIVHVTQDAATSNIDFALGLGSRIGGHVRQAGSGIGISDAEILLTDSHANPLVYAWTDSVGRYTIPMMPGGTYYAVASSYADRSQVFNHVDCPPPEQPNLCDPTLAGTPISVGRDTTVSGIDFDLVALPHINVTVHLNDGADPPFNADIHVYDQSGYAVLWQAITVGRSTVVGPLLPGSYYVTAGMQGYFTQLYDHVECATDCVGEFPIGTPVVLTDASTAPDLGFDLDLQATVSGRITDSGSGTGLQGVFVQLWPAGGSSGFVGAFTDPDGTYAFAGIPPGSYWIVARSDDHHDMMYANAPCLDYEIYDLSGCQLTQAQSVEVGHGGLVSGIDLALPLNASVSGAVYYRGPGQTASPIANAYVWLYNASGSQIRYGVADGDGIYRIPDVAAGSYFVETTGSGFFGQIYDGIDCPLVGQACDATVGTPVVLAQGVASDAIDFHVVGSRRLVGRVTDAQSGAGIPGIIIDSWNWPGDEFCSASATDSDGYYAIDDEYTCSSPIRKASTDAGLAYVDQVYAGILCPYGPAYFGLCSLDDATLIPFEDGLPVIVEANFVLGARVSIFANGFD